jgi:hypothetical protein
MNAETALNEQIKRYRLMTGEQRVAIALELHEMSCEVAREGIRRQNPTANAAEVERLLRRQAELERDERIRELRRVFSNEVKPEIT